MLLAIGATLSVLSITGCANRNAKWQIGQRGGPANEPVFVALEDAAKMKKLPRGTVLTISGAMWDKWSSKMERVRFDPEPGQFGFMVHRLPGGDEETFRMALLEFCFEPPCPPPKEPFPQPDDDLNPLDPPSDCFPSIYITGMEPFCMGTCDPPASCQPVIQRIENLGEPFGRVPVFGCACVD